jgi:exopolysaccharide production protein ExoZ
VDTVGAIAPESLGSAPRLRADRWNLARRLADFYAMPGGQGRTAALEGIRGLAIVLVFFVHYHSLFADYVKSDRVSYGISQFAGLVGHCGVDLFFVLSGFLIYGMLLRSRMPYRQFMRRRIERLYPTFVTVFAAYIVLSFVFPDESKIPSQPLPALWYLVENAALLPGLIHVTPVITVAWSLSYEFAFYAILPVAVYGLSLDSWPPASRVRLIVILGLVYVALFIGRPLPQLRASMFFVGMLLHEALISNRFKALLSARGERVVIVFFAAAFPAVYFLLTQHVASGADAITWSVPAVAVLGCSFSAFVAYTAGFDGGLRRILSAAPFRQLGTISYSFYLVHGLTLKAIARLVRYYAPEQATIMFWCLLPAAFLTSVASATALFCAVEKPFSLSQPATQLCRRYEQRLCEPSSVSSMNQ